MKKKSQHKKKQFSIPFFNELFWENVVKLKSGGYLILTLINPKLFNSGLTHCMNQEYYFDKEKVRFFYKFDTDLGNVSQNNL